MSDEEEEKKPEPVKTKPWPPSPEWADPHVLHHTLTYHLEAERDRATVVYRAQVQERFSPEVEWRERLRPALLSYPGKRLGARLQVEEKLRFPGPRRLEADLKLRLS